WRSSRSSSRAGSRPGSPARPERRLSTSRPPCCPPRAAGRPHLVDDTRGGRRGVFTDGTILALAVLAAGAKSYPHNAWKIVVLLAVTTAVFWLAHVYAHGLGHVLAQDRHLSFAELRRTP